MKRLLLMMTLSLIALAALPGCKITSGGYYAGSGIYNDDHSYGSGSSWDSDDDDWGSSSSREDAERDAYNRQEHSGGSGLTPPDRKIDPNMMIMSRGSVTPSRSGFQSADSRVIKVANKYAITHYAATYIVRAVELAKVDDESGIKDLGLSKKDFQKVLKGKLSDEKMEVLGSKLLMSTEDVEQLVVRIKNDVEYANSKN